MAANSGIISLFFPQGQDTWKVFQSQQSTPNIFTYYSIKLIQQVLHTTDQTHTVKIIKEKVMNLRKSGVMGRVGMRKRKMEIIQMHKFIYEIFKH